MLAIRLPEDIEKRLADLAERTGHTKTHFAREAILNYIEDMEDYYLAVEAYKEFLRSGEETLSSDELRRELGLED
jgi:RHH-type rel operon transcriptional repressor/antitoxin RelB